MESKYLKQNLVVDIEGITLKIEFCCYFFILLLLFLSQASVHWLNWEEARARDARINAAVAAGYETVGFDESSD